MLCCAYWWNCHSAGCRRQSCQRESRGQRVKASAVPHCTEVLYYINSKQESVSPSTAAFLHCTAIALFHHKVKRHNCSWKTMEDSWYWKGVIWGTFFRDTNLEAIMVPTPEQEGGFSTTKTVLVITIVMGCFAVLYPKIFYPMLFDSSYNNKPKASGKFWLLKQTILDQNFRLYNAVAAGDHHDMHRPPDRPNFHPGMRPGGGPGGAGGGPMFMGEEGKHFRRTLEKDLRVSSAQTIHTVYKKNLSTNAFDGHLKNYKT